MSNPPQATSLVNEYAAQLDKSFTELNVKIDSISLEKMAIFLVRAMGTGVRDYHRPEHSLDVSRVDRAIPRLAALFHDVVYLQIDSSWKEYTQPYFSPFLPSDAFSLNIETVLSSKQDLMLDAIAAIFGFRNEKHLLLSQGVNEFLSAIVFYRMVGPWIQPSDLLKCIVCIEETIPFRKIANPQNASLKLKSRLDEATTLLKMPVYSDHELDEIIIDVQKIIEKDLASFASNDLSNYLANTWSVLSENNPRLSNAYFLISEYRKALYSVNRFLQTIEPKNMYWIETTELEKRTSYNLSVGLLYLKLFSVSLSLLEAIAFVTGGDAPYETFVGPMRRSPERHPLTLENLLSLPKEIEGEPEVKQIYRVFMGGRGMRSRFDHRGSPLAAFLLHHLGIEKSLSLYELAMSYHEGHLTHQQFLNAFTTEVIQPLAEALTHTALTRKEKLLALIK